MDNCSIYETHQFIYDADRSGIDKSVFVCICGREQIEHEDTGTGC